MTVFLILLTCILFIGGSILDSVPALIGGYLNLGTLVIIDLGLISYAAILSNPALTIGLVIVFLALGVMYAVAWRFPAYVRQNRDIIAGQYEYWVSQIDLDQDNSFNAFLDTNDYEFRASNQKEKLLSWTIGWPAHIVWNMFSQPVTWIAVRTYTQAVRLFSESGRHAARQAYAEKKND
jgi:hypothetical protein